jgi:DNA polymerase (family 10)
VDNRDVAQLFGEIADLLEIKGENVFKVRAYRSASETIGAWPDPVDRMSEPQLRAIPGIGKDLAAKVIELGQTGACGYHQELIHEFPPTMLGLLRVQGVGPKTVALLYSALNVRSVDDLAAAAKAGRLRTLKGMGAKKEAQILKSLAERERHTGRHLLAHTATLAAELIEYLRGKSANGPGGPGGPGGPEGPPLRAAPDEGQPPPAAEFVAVGSLRRGAETCGDIDVLAVGGDASLIEAFTSHPHVERVLSEGDTKSSVLLKGGYQADLRLVPAASRGAAMQYFTGSKAHNIALRDRAIQRGLKLNEYGLFRAGDETRIAGDTEEALYEALGLPWIEPELREHRGEIEAGEQGTLPSLITRADLLGDLHMHTTATDGRDDLATMAAAAQRLGHRYIAITEHSKALAMANGMDERRLLAHAARVRALNGRYEGLTLLAGVECDILADGTLDLADDCLAQLDIVVASVHSQFTQEPAQATERVLRALACPWVDILGHPTARRLFKREPLAFDIDAVARAAAIHGVAMEINCQVERLDLNDVNARLARERGVRLVISTDAHSTAELLNLTWGLHTARRAWAQPDDVLNTLDVDDMRRCLRRNRKS